MSAIDVAIPTAGHPDVAKLRAIDPDTLARYVIDVAHPWWRRRPCAEALRDRVPEVHVPALLDRIRDPQDTPEVRVVLLDVLGDRVELLPWLQVQGPEQRYGIHEHILGIRARLADLTAAPQLATLAASPWNRSGIGETGLDLLITHHGVTAVEAVVGAERPEARMFANRLRSRELADLTPALADPDLGVARRASELILKIGRPDNDHLLDHVVTGPTIEARLFAAYILHRRGRDLCELWHAIDAPRVDVPGLPADVRGAIVRAYTGETHTDPRWLVERVCATLPAPPDEDAQLARAMAALVEAKLSPGVPQSAEESNGTGEGTFHLIETAPGVVLISTLGAFAAGRYDDTSNPSAARQALESAGFRWIDGDLGSIVVTGLPVYYFGRRNPLDVRTLLFYWQD